MTDSRRSSSPEGDASVFPTDPGYVDLGLALLRGALATFPRVGDAIAEVIALCVESPLQRRQGAFITQLGERLKRLEETHPGFTVDSLRENEEFASCVVAVVRSALHTHDKKKHELLQHAALNVALGRSPEADLLQTFLELVDVLTATHIRVLAFFHRPKDFEEKLKQRGKDGRLRPSELVQDGTDHVVAALPELASQREYVEFIIQDLMSKRLLAFLQNVPTVLAPNQTDLYTLSASKLSPLGRQFFEFVSAPELAESKESA